MPETPIDEDEQTLSWPSDVCPDSEVGLGAPLDAEAVPKPMEAGAYRHLGASAMLLLPLEAKPRHLRGRLRPRHLATVRERGEVVAMRCLAGSRTQNSPREGYRPLGRPSLIVEEILSVARW